MSLFKNTVGRPSNDTLKKRKIYRIALIIVTVTFILSGAYLLLVNMFPIIGTFRQAMSNVDSNKMSIQITAANSTRSLIIGSKQYSHDTWISQKTIGSNTVFLNNDGKTKLRIKATLSKQYFDQMADKGYAFWVVAYDKYGRRVATTTLDQLGVDDFSGVKDSKTNKVVKYVRTEDIKVASNVKYVRVNIQDPTKGTPTHYIQINTALLPTVNLKPLLGKANSKGIVKATNNNKEYDTIVTINNPSKTTLWYRWVKYNNFNMQNPDSFECRKITSTKIVTRGLVVKDTSPQRAGYVRVYYSESACKNDSKLNKTNATEGEIRTRNYLTDAIIKYELAKTYNAGDNWMRIRFDYNDLKSKIGKQTPGICFNYALAYGTYIKNGDGTYTKPYSDVSANYGASSYNATSYYKMYTSIKSKIDAGVPVSIHVGNSYSSHHWVLVTGYKKGLTLTKMAGKSKSAQASLLRSYLYVLDPYDLDHGPMSSEKHAAWFYGDMRYITW